jgi:tetratricopeptide (TPR) repeat protein
LDAPLIRKYLGIVYLEQGTATKALAQLLLARELQPTDDDVHKRILSAYDRLGDKTGAIQALKRSITMSPMNLDLYGILAHRLNEADDKIGSERAYTSMVEVKPNEAESHRRLAKVRDNQKRFKDAVVQWRQVIRVRTLEPDGWLGLARSQIHAGELDGAKKSIKHVLDTKWEARFKTAKTKARGLERLLQSKGG